MKKSLIASKAVALSVLLLAGCAGTSSETPVTEEPVKVVPLATEARLTPVPDARSAPQSAVLQDSELKSMTNKLSGGSVEIYDIEDDETASSVPVPQVQGVYDPVGIPMATDPRVTVYPVDGQSAYPGQFDMPGQAPEAWPNAVLPTGKVYKSTMTPGPEGWGNSVDGTMAVGRDGILVSQIVPDGATIFFPYGSSRLDSQDREVLSTLAQSARVAPVERVSIEGHASHRTQTDDPVKSKILNLKESMNRAYEVSQDLIQKGVPADKIQAVGWGDTKVGSESEPAQRRVDVYTGAGTVQ